MGDLLRTEGPPPLRGPWSSWAGLVAYLRDPLTCLVPLAARYGDPFVMGRDPLFVVTGHPEGIKQIYSADPATFAPLNQDAAFLLGSQSVLLQHGASHKRARSLLSPPFHGQKVKAVGQQIAAIAAARLDPLGVGARFSVLKAGQELSLEVILRAVFGVEERAEARRLGDDVVAVLHGVSPLIAMIPALRRSFFGMGPWATFERRRAVMREGLARLIAARRGAGGEDVLSLLLAARTEDGRSMDDDEVQDQLLTLVVAGHETTGTLLAWVMHAIHAEGQELCLERLVAEVDGIGEDPQDIAAAPYLDAVVKECLRRWPGAPAPAPRRLLRPFTLMGHELPEGAAVVAGIGLAHFREDVYPEPLQFRPERFLGRTYTPFEFLPFGGGARRCLGATLALWETKITLATWLRRARFRRIRRAEDPGAARASSVGPRHGVEVEIVERR